MTERIELWLSELEGFHDKYDEFPVRSDFGKLLFKVFEKSGYKVVGLRLEDDWTVTVMAKRKGR